MVVALLTTLYHLSQTVNGQGKQKVFTSDIEVELIKKKDIYFKYTETLDEHPLDVVMRVGTHDIRLSRRGIIQMNFHFVPHVFTDTFYESPAGRHHFRLYTRKLSNDIALIEIIYDLYEGETCIGNYEYILESSETNGS